MWFVICSVYMRTYIHNMVYVFSIVCTVYACGHACVRVHICVLLFVHISAGETLAGTKVESFSTSQRKTATGNVA